MYNFGILFSILIGLSTAKTDFKFDEELFQTKIKNAHKIVFYSHGDLFFNLISSNKPSVQQITFSNNFTTEIPNWSLRYFNPAKIIISQFHHIFLDKTNAGYKTLKTLLMTT